MKNRKSSVLFLFAAGLFCLLLWQVAASLSRNPLTAYGESIAIDSATDTTFVAAGDQTENCAPCKAEALKRTLLQEYLAELSSLNRAEAQAKTEALTSALGEEYAKKQARCNAIADEIRSVIEAAENSDAFRALSEGLQGKEEGASAIENWKIWSESAGTFTSLQEKETERFTLLREMKEIERNSCDKVKIAVMEVRSKFSPQKKALFAVFNAKMRLIEKAAGDCSRKPTPLPLPDPEFPVEPRTPGEIPDNNDRPTPGTRDGHPEYPGHRCPRPGEKPSVNPSANPGESPTDTPNKTPAPIAPAPSADNARTPRPVPPTGPERAYR